MPEFFSEVFCSSLTKDFLNPSLGRDVKVVPIQFYSDKMMEIDERGWGRS